MGMAFQRSGISASHKVRRRRPRKDLIQLRTSISQCPTRNTSCSNDKSTPANCQQDETDMPSLKRPGRQRTLLLMNNSDRAKYYRRINAELSIRREARVDFLRREVQRLEMQLQIIRLFDQLPTPLGSSTTTDCLAHAITKRLDESGRTLQDGRARVLKVAVVGASEAPIVRLEYVVRGRLQSHLVRRLYEFIVGNTVALEKMMFEEIEYGCTCFFHFSNDGIIERVDSESDEVNALREFLGSLRVLGPALLQMREVLV